VPSFVKSRFFNHYEPVIAWNSVLAHCFSSFMKLQFKVASQEAWHNFRRCARSRTVLASHCTATPATVSCCIWESWNFYLRALQSYRGVEVLLHSFFTPEPDTGEWSPLRPGRIFPGEGQSVLICRKFGKAARPIWTSSGAETSLASAWHRTWILPLSRSLHSHCTDWAIPVRNCLVL